MSSEKDFKCCSVNVQIPSTSFSQNSMTALIVAVKGGYTEVVKELLKRNPNANMMDKDGNTALAIAAKEGHIEIVQDLLDAGSYVNITDRVRRRLALRKGSAESKVQFCQVTFIRLLVFPAWFRVARQC